MTPDLVAVVTVAAITVGVVVSWRADRRRRQWQAHTDSAIRNTHPARRPPAEDDPARMAAIDEHARRIREAGQ